MSLWHTKAAALLSKTQGHERGIRLQRKSWSFQPQVSDSSSQTDEELPSVSSGLLPEDAFLGNGSTVKKHAI